MMEVEAKSIYGLARDISMRGTLNPTDLPIVIAEGSRFTVVEGNRRLCALRLLKKPQLAPDPADAKKFASLAKKYPSSITTVTASVAEDREAADVWIELKHTGPGAGSGTKGWGAQAKRTFNARRGGTKTFVEALSDAINVWYSDDAEIISDLYAVIHGDQLTNLERLIDSPEGRKFAGIQQSGNVIESQFPPKALKPFLGLLLRSLATPLPKKTPAWSRTWGNSDQRKDWMKAQTEVKPDVTQRSSTYDYVAPEIPSGTDPGQSKVTASPRPTGPKPQPGPKSPFDRPTLNFDGFTVNANYPTTIHVLVSEIQTLKISEVPNTIFDVLRTLVEKTIKSFAYLQKQQIPTGGKFVQFNDCLVWLESYCDGSQTLKKYKRTVAQMRTSKTKFSVTADAFNAANHDHYVSYGDSHVREAWQSLHDMMKELLKLGPDAH